MVSKVYSSLELAWQLLKPTSSPSGWTKTQTLSLLPGQSVCAPARFPGTRQQGDGTAALVTGPAHTILLCSAWGIKMRRNRSLWTRWQLRANNYGQIFTKPANLLPACAQTALEKTHRLDDLPWQWLHIPCHHPFHSSDTEENSPSKGLHSWSFRWHKSHHTKDQCLVLSSHMKKKHGLTQTAKCNGNKTTKQWDFDH